MLLSENDDLAWKFVLQFNKNVKLFGFNKVWKWKQKIQSPITVFGTEYQQEYRVQGVFHRSPFPYDLQPVQNSDWVPFQIYQPHHPLHN